MGQLSGKYEMTIADKKNNPPLYISKDTEIVRKLMNLYCSEMGEEIGTDCYWWQYLCKIFS